MAHGDITHVEIPVADTEAAQSFYNALFGWEFMTIEGMEGYPMWRAPNKISGGGLTSPEQGLEQPLSYVEVDSIDDILAKATDLGATVKIPKSQIDPSSWFAAFQDADGNIVGVYEGPTGADG